MVIDQHFGFILFSWLAGAVGLGGIALWIWWDRLNLDRQIKSLDAQGYVYDRFRQEQ